MRAAVAVEIPRILGTARAVAQIDVLAGLAQKAAENRYVAPEIDDGDTIRIVDGRHPAVERTLGGEPFAAERHADEPLRPDADDPDRAEHGREVDLDPPERDDRPDGADRLVRAGCEARIGVVDRVFTRIGSADDIGRSASTFMVEMLEIANILNNAGPKSLIVLDEVGRGTSTFDGLALAWAIVEHLHEHGPLRTLFATHYHQLTALSVAFSRASATRASRARVERRDRLPAQDRRGRDPTASYGSTSRGWRACPKR
jgi:DNA mismatch repair protein MutS